VPPPTMTIFLMDFSTTQFSFSRLPDLFGAVRG